MGTCWGEWGFLSTDQGWNPEVEVRADSQRWHPNPEGQSAGLFSGLWPELTGVWKDSSFSRADRRSLGTKGREPLRTLLSCLQKRCLRWAGAAVSSARLAGSRTSGSLQGSWLGRGGLEREESA